MILVPRLLRPQPVIITRYATDGAYDDRGYFVNGTEEIIEAKASVQPQRPYQMGGSGDTEFLNGPDYRSEFFIMYCYTQLKLNDLVRFVSDGISYRIMKVENWDRKMGTSPGMLYCKAHCIVMENQVR